MNPIGLAFTGGIPAMDVLAAVALVVAAALGSFAVIAGVLLGLPPDYFLLAPDAGRARRSVLRRVAVVAGRNLLGLALVAVGIVLLIPGVPGQGLLTILTGLILLDFPGKRGFERRLFARPAVLGAVNRLRVRFRRPPLQPPG